MAVEIVKSGHIGIQFDDRVLETSYGSGVVIGRDKSVGTSRILAGVSRQSCHP